jgi:hypothetical protein
MRSGERTAKCTCGGTVREMRLAQSQQFEFQKNLSIHVCYLMHKQEDGPMLFFDFLSV